MNPEYESEAHKEAVGVVKEFVYKEGVRAEKCECHGCKLDACDRYDWLFSAGDWRVKKNKVKKGKEEIEIDDDLDEALA